MGLDTTHDAFHGAYSSFNRFRQVVAKAMGGSFPSHEDKTLDDDRWYWDESYSRQNNPGLFEFMSHSDCDGDISPEMCKLVADELEQLLPKIKEIDDTTESWGHILRNGGFVATTERFIRGCRDAASKGEYLEFH